MPPSSCARSALIAFTLTFGMLPGETTATEKPGPAAAGSARPDWQAVAAARARVLSQVTWTPAAGTMPNRSGGYFQPGKTYTGVPYSSVQAEGRCIGFDIGLRTFLAAVENPLSVLYTESLVGKVPNAAAYYGAVCSTYTSYALQCAIPVVSRRHGPPAGRGIVPVHPPSAQAAQVGDVIYTPHETETSGSHVELVTGVTKDAAGRVLAVRIEESRPPTTKTTDRRAADFDRHLATRNRQLLRLTDPDAWRGSNRAESHRFPDYAADAATPVINRTLLLDLGDWVPYRKGQPVKFNILDRDSLGVRTLVIRRGQQVVEEILLAGRGLVERTFPTCGDYTAHVVRPDGSASPACEFAVCDLDLRLPAGSVSLGREWKVGFTSENLEIVALYLSNGSDSYGRHALFVTAEERRLGTITVPASLLQKPGLLRGWLIGEHRLGRLKARQDIRLTASP